MSCGICGRREVSGSCQDGYVVYLSGDYPCIFNKGVTEPRNLRELPALSSRAVSLSEERTQISDNLPEREDDEWTVQPCS